MSIYFENLYNQNCSMKRKLFWNFCLQIEIKIITRNVHYFKSDVQHIDDTH